MGKIRRKQILSRRKLDHLLLVAVLVMGGCSSENPSDPLVVDVPTEQTTDFSSQQAGSGGDQFLQTPISDQGGLPPVEWVERESDENSGENCATFSATAERSELQVSKEVPVEVVEEVVDEVVEEIVEEVVEEVPVSIYIMLDQSGSMWNIDIWSLIGGILGQPVPRLKWETAVDSINAFINDPNSSGYNVALQYFPIVDATCDGSVYDTPAVPMGRLPGNTPAIANSLSQQGGTGNGTPIEPALIGATEYCKNFKNDPVANPEGENCVVVLITDGMPTDCSGDAAYLANIAGEAYRNDGITTFAVGMDGADFDVLNMVAEQGQGDNDCHPDDPSYYCCNVNADMTLLQALETIREFVTTEVTTYETHYETNYVTRVETRTEYETVIETETLDCEWEIPPPPEKEVFDKNKVNVELSTTELPGDKTIIPMAKDETSCEDKVAWHYDNPDNPTRIVACPETCDVIKSAELGSIDIVLGCQVVTIE